MLCEKSLCKINQIWNHTVISICPEAGKLKTVTGLCLTCSPLPVSYTHLYSGKVFDKRAFIKSFITPEMNTEPYIGVLGVRVSGILEDMIRDNIQMDVENLTCTGRCV